MNNIRNTPPLSKLLLSDLGQLSSDLLKASAVIAVSYLAIKGLSYMMDEKINAEKTDNNLKEKDITHQSSSSFHFYDLVGLVHLF